MKTAQHNLFTRDDTLFGVCQGLGEDLGFHPNLLRVPFAVMLLWNPAVVLALYLGLGMVLAMVRWISPDPRPAVAVGEAGEAEAASDEFAIAA